VTGLTLRGIFLLRKKEIDWFYEGGASAIFPDAWELYRDFIPEDEREDFVKAYSKRLNSTDESVQVISLLSWQTTLDHHDISFIAESLQYCFLQISITVAISLA
jgi:hypothetical protein